MTIPLYEYPPAVDWLDLIERIREVYFIDLEDVSGRNSPAGNKRWDELKEQHLCFQNLDMVFQIFNEERPRRDYRDRYRNWIKANNVVNLNLAENTSLPLWEQEINNIIRAEIKDSPAYNADQQTLAVHVDW